jgi:lysozyme
MDDARLLEQLERHEGLRLKPYRDTVGKLTIGVGRNLTDVGLSESEARFLLRTDVTRVKADLDTHLPWWRGLDDVRARVLADMAFNLGIAGLVGFRDTLAAVRAGRWADAAAGMRASKWAGQVKGRAERLASMMQTGDDHGA